MAGQNIFALAQTTAKQDWHDFASSESSRSNPSPEKAAPARNNTNRRVRHNPEPARTPGNPNRNERELCLKFWNLPTVWTTINCFHAFSQYGNITNIFIFTNKDGSSRGEARITFAPPPKNFWSAGFLNITETKDGAPIRIGCRIWFDDHGKSRQYTEEIQVRAKRLGVGVMGRDGTLFEQFNTHEYPQESLDKNIQGHHFSPISVIARPEFHEFNIDFPVHHRADRSDSPLNRTDVLRVTFTLRQRLQVMVSAHPEKPHLKILAFNSEIVPKCSRKGEEDKFFKAHPYSWNERDSYYRQTDVLLDPQSMASRSRAASLRRDDSVINLGRWTAYFLIIDTKSRNNREGVALEELLKTFKAYNVDVSEMPNFYWANGRDLPTAWTFIDPAPQAGQSSLSELLGGELPLSFNVRYQLEVCISGGWLNEYDLDREWIDKLRTLDPMRACALLEYVATDRPDQRTRRIQNPFAVFKWSVPKHSVLSQQCPAGKVVIRSATVTPTTVIFNTPSIEISNRVIRHFSKDADRFLRIRFLDERTMGRIYGRSASNIDNEVYTRIKRVLTNGIEVSDRHYDLLAWGNSQFRENGAYFFANTRELTADMIRNWMGDFSDIKVVAKYAARIGQCFSTTRAVSSVKPKLVTIPDVERNGCNFTDGVGKIGPLFAGMAGKDFRLASKAEEVPSAYQFRLGGYKGVLAVWPEMKGLELYLRPSQDKFKAFKAELEIIRHSQATEFSLNRQLIMVLSALGVSDEIFLEKAAKQVDLIQRSMTDPNIARDTLRSSIDANHTTPMIADMVVAGFQANKEPFLMALLYLWRAWSIKYLKEKAKIHISQGAVVIGITDEEKVLRGHFDKDQHFLESKDMSERLKAVPEVFLQLSDLEGTGQSKVMTGLMILARNPSLHAGDIRVVQGVDHKKLRHLKDVVVLPQTGDRDISGMCSGGDLDGDDYLVCWDPELIPPEWNVVPMDFTPPPPVKKQRVSLDDLTSFYVRYMKNTELGQIAHHHLAHADLSGVKSDKCCQLAQLHSNAVDYPKTGVPAIIPEELRIKKWPHYMEKRNSYKSNSALGKLYDNVRREGFEPPYDNPFDLRVLEAYPTSQEQEQAAAEIKANYDAALRRLMQQHGIKTEFEVFSTFVMDYNRNMSDYKFAEELGQDVSAIKEQYVDLCVEKAGGRHHEVLAPFVVAMYKITQEQVSTALYECDNIRVDQNGEVMPMRAKTPESMPFMSFPWLFSHTMCKIAREYQALKQGISESGVAVLDLGTAPTANNLASVIAKTSLANTAAVATVSSKPTAASVSVRSTTMKDGLPSKEELGMSVLGESAGMDALQAAGQEKENSAHKNHVAQQQSLVDAQLKQHATFPAVHSQSKEPSDTLVDLLVDFTSSSDNELNGSANNQTKSERSGPNNGNENYGNYDGYNDDDDDESDDPQMDIGTSAMDELDSMFD